MAAATIVWFLHEEWFPTVRQAIIQLPAEGEIRFSKLDWHGDTPLNLAESRFLAFTVDLDHTGQARSPAHLQIEFGLHDLRVFSLFGFLPARYPAGWRVAFNQVELQPWWGAWAPNLLGLVAGSVLAGLFLVWASLATVYCFPAWLIGFFANRSLTLGGSWRLSGAALMPGALFFTLALFCYAVGALDPLQLTVAAIAHFVVGWVYVVAGTLSLSRLPGLAARNPFVPSGPPPTEPPTQPKQPTPK